MLTVTFLGTGAACPTVDRNVAGLAVQREGETILFDCGEGTQRQMMRYGVGLHLRRDLLHPLSTPTTCSASPACSARMGLQDRTAPVTLYGPRGAQRMLGAAIEPGHRAQQVSGRDRGDPGRRPAGRRDEYDIVVFETEHRADTVGYALAEHTRLGRFHPERARELGIPEGPLWGRLHKGETVTLDDGRTVTPGGPRRRAAARPYGGLLRRHPAAPRR